jgi:hypothetical protein
MSDSSVRHEVEQWIREDDLPKRLGQPFSKKKLELPSGQIREIDAVSADGRIVVEISTSTARTATGNPGTGAMRKIKGDVRDLALIPAPRRIVCVTEPEMAAWIERQKTRNNFPANLEVLTVDLPRKLRASLTRAQRESSQEMLR